MKALKAWVQGSLVLILLGLAACGEQVTRPDNLPWQVTVNAAGYTQVFQLELGKTTLKEMIETLQHFPEMAVFQKKAAPLILEAYFGKRRLGVLDARLIAELEASEAQLKRFVQENTERKPQPSGAWKYSLSEDNVQQANQLAVKYVMYIPAADYSPDIVNKHFGEPDSVQPINAQAAYWLYPDKGLILLLNADGSEVFHYSSPQDYAALKQRLLQSMAEAK